MKICKCCKEQKKPEDFRSLKVNCTVCLQCQKKNRKKYSNSDKRRDNQFKQRYGIGIKEYNILLENQNNCCAICKKNKSELSTNLHVDHDHLTGKVRGLLCFNCNSGLGRFKDNIEYLLEAATYLKCTENQ